MWDINREERSIVEAKCPECRQLMANIGLDFQSPKKDDIKTWSHIRDLYSEPLITYVNHTRVHFVIVASASNFIQQQLKRWAFKPHTLYISPLATNLPGKFLVLIGIFEYDQNQTAK